MASGGAPLIVYDMSFPLLGIESAYDGTDTAAWTVIADCTAENGHGVAVLPTDLVDDEIRDAAKARQYDHLLAECGGTPTPTP